MLSGFSGLTGFPVFNSGMGSGLTSSGSAVSAGTNSLSQALASGMNSSSAAASLLQFLRSSSPRGPGTDLNGGPGGLPSSLASSLGATLSQSLGGLGQGLGPGFSGQNGGSNGNVQGGGSNSLSPSLQDGDSRTPYWGSSRNLLDRQENSGSPSIIENKVRNSKFHR